MSLVDHAQEEFQRAVRRGRLTPTNAAPETAPLVIHIQEAEPVEVPIPIIDLRVMVDRLGTEIRAAQRTLDSAKRQHAIIEKKTVYPRMAEIIDAVCSYYNVSKTNLVGRCRTAKFIRPRHVACYLGKSLTLLSTPEIGRKLGGRDHTAVLHGARKITARIQTDFQLASEVASLACAIRGENTDV